MAKETDVGLCKMCEGTFLLSSLTNETCKTCSGSSEGRHCGICKTISPGGIWEDGKCPICKNATGSSTVVSVTDSKPSIIDTLSTLGWVLFAMTGLSGVFLISQDGGGILGVSLIIAGVFQLSIFLGFSAIIDQLYKINVNTSKPDKADS